MRVLRLFWVVLFPLVLGGLALHAATPQRAPVVITKHSDNAIRLTFANDAWLIETNQQGERYIQMPALNYDPDGLPQHTVVLGVPTADVKLKVLSTRSRLLRSGDLLHLDSAETLTTLDASIQMRDQHAARLTFHPVQREGDGVRVYTSVKVELSWDSAERAPQKPNHPAYEQVLARTLFNYELLDRPTPRGAPQPRVVKSDVVTPSLRIEVDTTGLYQLTYADLDGAGFPISGTAPSDLLMTHRSRPVAVLIEGGMTGHLIRAMRCSSLGRRMKMCTPRRMCTGLRLGTGCR